MHFIMYFQVFNSHIPPESYRSKVYIKLKIISMCSARTINISRNKCCKLHGSHFSPHQSNSIICIYDMTLAKPKILGHRNKIMHRCETKFEASDYFRFMLHFSLWCWTAAFNLCEIQSDIVLSGIQA